MSNRPAWEDNIDNSEAALSWSRSKRTLLDLIIAITPSFHTDKSILKGELALTIMKIEVVWIVVWLKELFDDLVILNSRSKS